MKSDMNIELQNKLFEKYPKIFRQKDLSMQETCMCWGINTGPGWYWLIDKLCSNLQRSIDNNNKDYVIKNKLLRRLLPILDNIVQSIPVKYNFKKKKQYNLLIYIKRKLINLISNWKRTREFIYIEANRYPQIEATQVKEKFGGLRFYTNGCTIEQNAMISFAEDLSYNICEYCGTTKNVGLTKGWLSTICKDCHSKIENRKDLKWKENET